MSQVTSEGLAIELLCAHHRLDDFDCGSISLNENLASRVGDYFPAYDPDEGLILVAHDQQAVRGYLWVSELLIQLESDGQSERCFYLAYFGVDRRWQGSEVASQLVDRARDILHLRLSRRKHYAAEVATTLYDGDSRIAPLLERIGFDRVPGNSLLWFRRNRSSRT